MQMNDDVKRSLRLLAEGKIGAAESMAFQAKLSIEGKRRDLDAALAMLDEILEVTSGKAPHGASTTNDPPAGSLGRASRAEQRLAVLAVADELSDANPGQRVTTDGIHDALIKQGIQPPSKTGIGLIINHADGWEKLGRGVYGPTLERRKERLSTALSPEGLSPEEVDEAMNSVTVTSNWRPGVRYTEVELPK